MIALPNTPPFPVPLSSAGVSFGLLPNLDISTHLHLTSLIATGVFGFDFGTSWMPLTQSGAIPAITVTARLHGFTDFRSGFRPYLETEGAVSWRYARYFGSYFTTNTLFQLLAPPIFTLAVGQELVISRVGLQLEARWYQPFANTSALLIDYASFGHQGAFGILIGVRVRFGDQR